MGQWERLLPLGFFYGVTTNPVLLERAGVTCSVRCLRDMLMRARTYPGVQEVMFQAWGEDTDTLVANSLALRDLDPKRVVVKLPLTPTGLRAAALLRKNFPRKSRRGKMKLCMTACYSAGQGLVAAGLRSEYVAPYLGRMADLAFAERKAMQEEDDADMEAAISSAMKDDAGMEAAISSAMKECTDMHAAVGGGKLGATRILVASLRSADQMVRLAAAGLDTFTFSPEVCDALVGVAATGQAAAEFERAARSAGAPGAS